MFGVLLVDKPQGKTSHQVISKLRKVLNIKRIGHAGTLDPLASGLLVVCIGKATKISQYMMSDDKKYQFEVVFGQETTTFDDEGDVLATYDKIPSLAEVEKVLPLFCGQVLQTPPMYSAIKKDGKKLYEYARKGQVIEVEPRAIFVHSLEVLEMQNGIARMQIHCSKGTYVRSVAHDLGKHLGTGAIARNIRRLQSGSFVLKNALTWDDLEISNIEKSLISIEDALLPTFSFVSLTKEEVQKANFGQPLKIDGSNINDEETVLLVDAHQHAIGLGQNTNGEIKVKKVF